MSKVLPKKIKPVNRHLTIVPHFSTKEESESSVLLPDGFQKPEERYIVASVLDVASDCSLPMKELNLSIEKAIVVDQSMIEEINISDKKYYIILENYVIGILKNFNELN